MAVKQNLRSLTKAQLSAITGKNVATITKRLAHLKPVEMTGRSLHYDPHDALPLIYMSDGQTKQDAVNIDEEKARLTRAKADKAEIEVRQMAGELVRSDQVEKAWSNILQAFKSRIRAIPRKIAPMLLGQTKIQEVEKIVKEQTDEALNELSEFDATEGID